MVKLVLHLGSNLGEPAQNLLKARESLVLVFGTVEQASKIYLTQPWGKPDQNDFLNQVLVFETNLLPMQCLDRIQSVESALGRKPAARWDARIIDIDILFYGNQVMQNPQLTIPHPHIPARKFVLIPVCEILPDWEHPQLHRSMKTLLKQCNDPLSVRIWKP